MPIKIIEITREQNPFSRSGMRVDDSGRLQYPDLPRSLADMLHRHVQEKPDVEAVVECGGRRATYRELWDTACRIGGTLRRRGLQTGDRVAVMHPAGIDWVEAFWGIVLAGGVAVAPNTRLPQADVDYILHDAGATLTLGPDSAAPDSEPITPVERDPDDVVALFYTSGTTGRPKGVPFTHSGVLTSSRNLLSVFHIDPKTTENIRTLISVPLFHVTGCNTQMMVMMYVGGTSVIMPTFGKQEFLVQLKTERINYVITVPAIYAMLLRMAEFTSVDTTNVRWLAYGGSAITPDLVRSLKAAFPHASVVNGFGMTETTSIITALPDQDAVEYADSIGYAVPAVDIAFAVEGDDTESGELLARGTNVSGSYWNKPGETADAYHDGWYWTGDVVRVDRAGRVFLIDRKKDLIIRGGENISSLEIESAVAGIPGVIEVAAIPVADEILGEKVGVVVRLDDQALSAPELVAHCRQLLAKHQVPEFIAVVDEPLPRSAAGKVLKRSLRDGVRWQPA